MILLKDGLEIPRDIIIMRIRWQYKSGSHINQQLCEK